ncbi:predicted protein [Uncinocarpus reesii 1704]|uniref:GP-PDE domain-containing protein n=1 Tax=Uncinocarpus reesii (strain UAMH 1704) TaxID=336963 RepID=C4JKG9_UNCRE|nr:uncharacterized protein UREG_02126 [Uncinocarpus reesii 1704]EEP77277.1 predicted protein [Uncinocarpus reesii 1704]
MSRSKECFKLLVIDTEKKGLSSPDYLNRFIVSLGHRAMSTQCDFKDQKPRGVTPKSDADFCAVMFDLFHSGQIEDGILRSIDYRGRSPLHYAAAYGVYDVCKFILDRLVRATNAPNGMSPVEEALLWKDVEGNTPLQLAVVHGHATITETFLVALNSNGRMGQGDHLLQELLFIAVKYQHDDIVRLIFSASPFVKPHPRSGETPLHVAAQIGREDYVKLMLENMTSFEASIDVAETLRGWTPLTTASALGHVEIVELLLQAGASQAVLDHRGWTAKEHATFRGHFSIAKLLETPQALDPLGGPGGAKSGTVAVNAFQSAQEAYVIMNLGAMQSNKQTTTTALNCLSSDFDSMTRQESFSLVISTVNEGARILQLPVLDDGSSPLVFPIKNLSDARMDFKLYQHTNMAGRIRDPIGYGTALLENTLSSCMPNRELLTRTHSVSILSNKTAEFMGTLSFTYVIANPFVGISNAPMHPFQKESRSVQLVGHRVMSFSKNTWIFIRRDAQVTKDLVPVIYHDFSLSESGTDVPIHDVNLKQVGSCFTALASVRSQPQFLYAGKYVLPDKPAENSFQRKSRSRSLTREDSGVAEANARLQHTVDFISKGFKPNSRGTFIQSPFATLEDLLVKLPKDLGFVIELKYPRLHEAADAGVAPVAIEVNAFVDAILDRVYRFGQGRTIVFGSFTPEICILLSRKAREYPIMFITNAGKLPISDREKRGASLQVAVQFAKQWELTGIVLAADALLLCPRLIKYVQNSGLLCASYGLVNNIPENAKVPHLNGMWEKWVSTSYKEKIVLTGNKG